MGTKFVGLDGELVLGAKLGLPFVADGVAKEGTGEGAPRALDGDTEGVVDGTSEGLGAGASVGDPGAVDGDTEGVVDGTRERLGAHAGVGRFLTGAVVGVRGVAAG